MHHSSIRLGILLRFAWREHPRRATALPSDEYSVSSQGAASGGGSIATLTDLDSLEVEAEVNEASLAQLRPLQPAEITVDAFPGRKWRGRVRQIVPRADRSKGSVKVKVEILDAKDKLLPDMSSSVSFLNQERSAQEISEKPGACSVGGP